MFPSKAERPSATDGHLVANEPLETQSAFASFYANGALRRNSVQWTFYTLAVQFVGRLRAWCTGAALRPN